MRSRPYDGARTSSSRTKASILRPILPEGGNRDLRGMTDVDPPDDSLIDMGLDPQRGRIDHRDEGLAAGYRVAWTHTSAHDNSIDRRAYGGGRDLCQILIIGGGKRK